MEKDLFGRGVLCGAIAGLLAFVFGRIFAEPYVQQAIDYEAGREAAQALLDKAAGLPAEPDLFSRTVQADVGLGVGMIAFGIGMGALFALVYAVCLGRVGRLGPRPLALLVAAAGFLGLYLVPFLRYPANPPAIGDADTIQQRTGMYLLMVLSSVLLLALAVWLGQRLRGRFGNWNASLLAGAAFVLAIGIVMALLPSFGQPATGRFAATATETPLPLTDANGAISYPGFPADVLFYFRLYSVAGQLLLWAAIGLLFAPMADRLLRPAAHPVNRADAAA
ncbi:MAG TPA: CbtA family protein [Jatrophihabitans sp.]|nr:CbtA family protein [Jatrophihabitans sp.]